MRRRRKQRKRMITIGLAVVLVAVALVVFIGMTQASDPQQVLNGVHFMGQDLSGMDWEKAKETVSSLGDEYLDTPVAVSYQDSNWELVPKAAGIALQVDAVLKEIEKVGQEGSFWKKWQDTRRLQREGLDVSPQFAVDKAVFAEKLEALTADIITPPKDASVTITANDKVEINPGQEGMKVDLDKAEKDILSLLADYQTIPKLTLTLSKVQPEITSDTILGYGLDTLLGSYRTNFNANVTDRSFNIRVAASALDNIFIAPGEKVSFNDVVGPRSSEAGYKTAKVIVNNEFVDGLGGGVCQVSTTLYNAVLLAGLEVVTRSNHSLPVTYVPAGRDATVSYDSLDFVFRNNTDKYLYLKTYVEGGTLGIKIFGNSAYKKDVRLETSTAQTYDYTIKEKEDPSLPEGEKKIEKKGIKGSKVVGKRIYTENGQTREEALPVSVYNAQAEVVLVGTQKADAEQTETNAEGQTSPNTTTPNSGSQANDNTSSSSEGNASGDIGGGIMPPGM